MDANPIHGVRSEIFAEADRGSLEGITCHEEGFFVDRMEGNEEIFDRIMNDPAFRNLASDQLMREVYKRLRDRQRHAEKA